MTIQPFDTDSMKACETCIDFSDTLYESGHGTQLSALHCSSKRRFDALTFVHAGIKGKNLTAESVTDFVVKTPVIVDAVTH